MKTLMERAAERGLNPRTLKPMHPIIAKIDEAEASLAALPPSVPDHARATARGHLDAARSRLAEFLADPAPGSIEHVGGAKITHRPDVVEAERVLQAQMLGDAGGYLPVREALAKDAGGDITHQGDKPKPAEIAEPGMTRR